MMPMPPLVLLILLNPFQVRNFTVEVQGVGTGSYRQEFFDKQNGATEIVTVSSLRAKVLIASYHYNFTSAETWKQGKLVHATAEKNDNGTVTKMTAGPGQADWVSSFWTLPDKRKGNINIFDFDSGRVVVCTLQFVGVDKTGRHWKVSGGLETDLWYDEDGMLVKRTMLRKGRPATVTLIRS